MDEIIEIEDIVGKTYQNAILDRFTAKDFPWYLNKNLVSPDMFTGNNDKEINPLGWNHFLYEENKVVSPVFEFVHPLVMIIQDLNLFPNNSLERMRANLAECAPHNSQEHHLPHIDSWYEHYNVIYYMNDGDGDTFIMDQTNKDYNVDDFNFVKTAKWTVKKRITPKKGKIIAFPGHYYHASSPNRKDPYRIVLNINFAEMKIGP